MNEEIDFVLTYLNPNDVEWQAEKNKFIPGEMADVNPNRYREWNNLQYFFRGVEKYAPWVRKVHVVTCGHVPEWLNTNHPKVNIVKHKDYIPADWLPTFSSRCIDMNFHRIPELAEHFVYFNDDMFITNPVEPEDFFKDGKPCDTAILVPNQLKVSGCIALHLAPVVDTAVINSHFDLKKTVRQKRSNWISTKYGRSVIRSMFLMSYPKFCGFKPNHLPYSYLKSTYQTVWNEEAQLCTLASSHRFREVIDVNHWIFTYWQYATNQFYPRKVNDGYCFQLRNVKDAEKAKKSILAKRYKLVCLNDTLEDNSSFETISNCVNMALKTILDQKSMFEQ
ncbi:hypothetical protein MUB23_01785 [Cuneatibacter sp. NSJ-177]|uniref:hypothetical protein n=1 Tax=Cuneatibacter sp. NSJ-177 TaxID=2931401 RepID=UPI001FD43030|nr:hypothetical protein [Cuneatibacter sp. NSJ-177]MCJ7834127.1 hypothetical protein [Cuneatibacter sp. NSJ-177]